MSTQKLDEVATPTNDPGVKSAGGGISKPRYERARILESGLLEVERRSGKFFDIARQNQQESPLLKLPPEIRNQIFQLAIGDKKYHTLSEPSRSFLRRWEDKHAVALLRCCRQIYAETALLPWSQYTFKFSTSQQMRIWFRQQRAVYCNVMTKVEFNFAMRSIGRGPNMGPGRCRLGTGSEPASWILPNLPALQSIRVSVKASDFCFCFQDTKVATEAMQDAQKSLQDELRVLHPNIVILGSTYSEDS